MFNFVLTGDPEDLLDKVAGIMAFKIQRVLIEKYPKSFSNLIVVNKEGKAWEIGSNNKIFIFFEVGTKAHEIKAKNRFSLEFEWPKMGEGIIAGQPNDKGMFHFKKVKHPGTEGKFILDDVANDTALMNRLLNESIKEALG